MCPPDFPAGFYWYGEKRSGPGRPPKWVSKLLDKLLEDNDDNGTCIDKDGKDESDDGLMHESTDESQSEPTALEPIESQKTVTWMEPVKTIIPMEPNEPQHRYPLRSCSRRTL